MERRLSATGPEKNGEEVIEPEMIFDGFRRREPRRPSAAPGRFRALASGALALAGLVLLLPGALLSASLIGAIFGVPLMLAGSALLLAAFRLAAGGRR